MKTLIVYPTYAITNEEVAYRATTVVNAAMGYGTQSKTETFVTPFNSTSPMLRGASGPRRSGDDDWSLPGTPEYGDSGNSGGDFSIGAATPIGDVVLPMMLMLLAYTIYRRIRTKLA